MQTDMLVAHSGILRTKQFSISLIAMWFGSTIVTFFFATLMFVYVSTEQYVKPTTQIFQPFAALPDEGSQAGDNVGFADARAKIIENFFKENNSLLAAHSTTFLEVADRYNLDYRLLPSIAMQESNGGKRVIKDSHNPFGYGIYGDKVVRFSSWEEAIERVGRALREDYVDKGLQNPQQIMAKYTPPSLALGGAWAKGVSYFMEELR